RQRISRPPFVSCCAASRRPRTPAVFTSSRVVGDIVAQLAERVDAMARLRQAAIFHRIPATAARSGHSSQEKAVEKDYLEDLAPGQVFTSQARVVVGADAIKRFAGEFDPQPWHLNETVARSTFFKELVASGWHTTALTMQLIIQTLPLSEAIIRTHS